MDEAISNYGAVDAATVINVQIGTVRRVVEAFNERVERSEIRDLADSIKFLETWLEGMKTLAQ